MSKNCLLDAAVLTGSLTWVKVDNESRTTARLLLTLTLSRSQYPEVSEGDTVYVSGAQVEFGDGETGGDTPLPMQVCYDKLAVCSELQIKLVQYGSLYLCTHSTALIPHNIYMYRAPYIM